MGGDEGATSVVFAVVGRAETKDLKDGRSQRGQDVFDDSAEIGFVAPMHQQSIDGWCFHGPVEEIEQDGFDIFVWQGTGALQGSEDSFSDGENATLDLLQRCGSALSNRRKVVVERGLHNTRPLREEHGREGLPTLFEEEFYRCIEQLLSRRACHRRTLEGDGPR